MATKKGKKMMKKSGKKFTGFTGPLYLGFVKAGYILCPLCNNYTSTEHVCRREILSEMWYGDLNIPIVGFKSESLMKFKISNSA